jgi:hypothetical protein
VAVDGGEIVDHIWMRPADALAKHAAGELQLMPPTWVTLLQLSQHATVDATVAHAASSRPKSFDSRFATDPAGTVFLYAGDVAYDDDPPDIDKPGPRRRLDTRVMPWEWIED